MAKKDTKKRMTAGKVALTGLGIGAGLFAVTFTVYMFNLDMKLTAMIEPFMLKHYDRIERDQHL